jgi:hypothetical protein
MIVRRKQHIGLRTSADPLGHRPKSTEIRYVFRTGRNDGIEVVPTHEILEASDIGEHLASAFCPEVRSNNQNNVLIG